MKTKIKVHKGKIEESELVLNGKGNVYHLDIGPDDLAHKIILVGDPARVNSVCEKLENVSPAITNREFVTRSGVYKGTPITVIGTGIGIGNIDIVVNECDAAVNIDLKTRLPKEHQTKLEFVRIGTCGGLQPELSPGSFVTSKYSIGFDSLLDFYDVDYEEDELQIQKRFKELCDWEAKDFPRPYVVRADSKLFDKISHGNFSGITATSSGFYGPQGRTLRLNPKVENFTDLIAKYSFGDLKITNLEMETSSLYGLAHGLGHSACTICTVIANRYAKEFKVDYKKSMDDLIVHVLEQFTKP